MKRPAVSRKIASSVNHQSQLRVPPMPLSLAFPPPCSTAKFSPELRRAVVFPEPGGADEHVPREVVEGVAPFPLFERRHGVLESLAQLHDIGRRRRLGMRLLDDRLDEPVAGETRAKPPEQPRDDPERHDERDRYQARIDRLEGVVVGKREVRPRIPDERGYQNEADQEQERAPLEK